MNQLEKPLAEYKEGQELTGSTYSACAFELAGLRVTEAWKEVPNPQKEGVLLDLQLNVRSIVFHLIDVSQLMLIIYIL